MRISSSCAAAAPLFLIGCVAAQDWPGWRGPTGDGYAALVATQTLQ